MAWLRLLCVALLAGVVISDPLWEFVDEQSNDVEAEKKVEDLQADPSAQKPTTWNCWNACHKETGNCAACGTGGACCRRGWKADGCDPHTANHRHHSCQYRSVYVKVGRYDKTIRIGNKPISWNCWNACRGDGRTAYCRACGTGGSCCRRGWKTPGCDPATANKGHHSCQYSVFIERMARSRQSKLKRHQERMARKKAKAARRG